MKAYMITPIAHLELSKMWEGRFCLAHIAKRHPEYYEFFKEESRRGYTVILDNSAFEEELVTEKELEELAAGLMNCIIVIPDQIGHAQPPQDTIPFIKRMTKALKPTGYHYEFMFVPQVVRHPNPTDVTIERMMEWLRIGDFPFTWLGICHNFLFNGFGKTLHCHDQELLRFYWGAELQLQGRMKALMKKYHIHLLGLGGNIKILQHLWWADSVDTASVFWQSYLGNEVLDGQLPELPHRPKDYFTSLVEWESYDTEMLKTNSKRVLYYTSRARDLRRELEGIRL